MGVEVFVADEQSEYRVDHLRWLKLAEQVLDADHLYVEHGRRPQARLRGRSSGAARWECSL